MDQGYAGAGMMERLLKHSYSWNYLLGTYRNEGFVCRVLTVEVMM